jgi:hypothetical protein
MGVRVSAEWKFRGLTAVILENRLIRAVILPELGAKLWQITYKPADRELLWHHPRIKPRTVPTHAIYDDVFFGGWDELYPNDIPEPLLGEPLPDHGELWTLPWEFEIQGDGTEEASVRLWVETPVTSSRMEKRISLREAEGLLRFRHRLSNTGREELPFLWKLHAAMKADEYSRIDLGAKSMYIESFGTPRNGETLVSYEWPYITDKFGVTHDMRQCKPSDSRLAEFQYATELKAGWCALTDTKSGIGMGIAFDPAVFRSCWLFASYGGWRNLQTVVLEPCTGYPVSVADGIAQGTHRVLAAGESIECDVTAVIYEGYGQIDALKLGGGIEGERI